MPFAAPHMPLRRAPVLTVALIAGVLSPDPAAADVTPAQVWEAWQAAAGPNLTAEDAQTAADGTLTLTGVTGTDERTGTDEGTDEGTGAGSRSSVDLGDVVMRPLGDGTVAIEVAPTIAIVLTAEDRTGGDMRWALTVAPEGLTTIASGESAAIDYAVAADRIAVTLDSVTRGGTARAAEGSAAVTDLAAVFDTTAGDAGTLSLRQEMTAATLSMTLDTEVTREDEAAPGRLAMTGNWTDLAATVSAESIATTPTDAGPGDYRSGSSVADGAIVIAFEDESGRVEATTVHAGAEAEIDATDGAARYSSAVTDLDLSISGSRIPLTSVDASVARLDLSGSAPMVPGEGAFAGALTLDGVTVDEAIWSLLDPEALLPRDPARLLIDLSGTAVVPASPEDGADATGAPQMDVRSVTVRALELAAAGAALTGSGSLDFPEGTTDSEAGLPPADGAFDLRLDGAQALVETLVRLGIVGQDQAAGAMMMMGLFTTPVPGEDALTTTVTVAPDGRVSVNGQRVR